MRKSFTFMRTMTFLQLTALALVVRMETAGRLGAALHPSDRERGDVPGWVMITLMSAILVAALLAIAGPALETMFNEAMNQVRP